MAAASPPGARYFIICRSMNSLAVPARPLIRSGSEYTKILASSRRSIIGSVRSVVVSTSSSVAALAARLAMKTQPTPKSVE